MAAMEWVYKGALAIGGAVVGFFALPMLYGAVTGVLAGLFDVFGAGVPTVLTLEFGTQLTVPLAILGLIGGGYWAVRR